jgi:hypothetical protein
MIMKHILLAAMLLITGYYASAQKLVSEPTAQKLPQGKLSRPVGIGALKVNPFGVPFTADDVAAWLKKHNLPGNRNTSAQLQVQSLEFLTAADAAKRLQGVETGLNPTEQVGFATLEGPVAFEGPQGKTALFDKTYAAFDATSGNLLLVGSLK